MSSMLSQSELLASSQVNLDPATVLGEQPHRIVNEKAQDDLARAGRNDPSTLR